MPPHKSNSHDNSSTHTPDDHQAELRRHAQTFLDALRACDRPQLHRLYDLTFGRPLLQPIAEQEAQAIHALRLLIEAAGAPASDERAASESQLP
jgi:hypothetical protein